MIADVVQESQPDLEAYASVSIAFEVREIVRPVADPRSRRFRLEAQPVTASWTKDYDALDGGPRTWPERFDLSRWAFFAARLHGKRVGGAAVVYRAPGFDMLRGRDDVALLWDIRVAPDARGKRVGGALLDAVTGWAASHGARSLEAETQDINAPACRFYGRHGFELVSVDPNAYRDLPNETQLIWSKAL